MLETPQTVETVNEQKWIMACISNSPFAVNVLKHARLAAKDTHSELLIVHVESPFLSSSKKADGSLGKNLELADELGTKVLVISSSDVASEIVKLAHQYKVTQIILGKPLHTRWHILLQGSVVEDIISRSGNIGVYLVSGEPLPTDVPARESEPGLNTERIGIYLLLSLGLMALVTILSKIYGDYLGITNIGMLYLLPVVFAAARLPIAASLLVAVVSVLLFDVFFIPPVLHLVVNDARHLITFIVFLVVAFTTGNMAQRLRFRISESIHREARTRALYDLAKGLSAVTEIDLLAKRVVAYVSETLESEVVLYLPESDGNLNAVAASKAFSDLVLGPNELATAEWTFQNSQPCGIGTETFAGSKGFYLPLQTEEKTLGVLGIKPDKQLFTLEQITLLEALVGLTALAIARLRLATEAQTVRTLEESERLRTALFNSISHDMKTPLASILGAISSLVDEGNMYDDEQKAILLTSIKQGALRMNRVIGNLLNSARLESGFMRLHTDWCDIQDIVGVALRENRELLQDYSILVEIPGNLRLIKVDYGLIEQVLTNLLHNAAKFSPVKSEISIQAVEHNNELLVSVADQGKGIPAADKERIFDKFYRLQSPMNVSGTGLGLSICRGILEAHGGRIWFNNRPGGGSQFTFTLPIEDQSPRAGEEN